MEHVDAYRARGVTDPALQRALARYGNAPDTVWSDRQLALAALFLRPEIAVARAEWRAARAGERSAGARPRPGVSGELERAFAGAERESPWVGAIAALFTVELGGKRGARLAAARARSLGAEVALANAAAAVAHETRAAALDVIDTEAELADADRIGTALERVAALTESRYEEGGLGLSAVALARSERQAQVVAAAARRTTVRAARARLARAVGMVPDSLAAIHVTVDAGDACDRALRAPHDSLARVALTRHGAMAAALADYALAEANLRIAVAGQWPDLGLGPGLVWDEGVQRWAVSAALSGLPIPPNRGPVAEAELRRTAAAERVRQRQETILADVAAALEACRGAAVERAVADSVVAAAVHSVTLAEAAYQRGESARLPTALAEIEVLRARAARRAAERGLAAAGLAVDAATAAWGPVFGVTDPAWPDLRTLPELEDESR